jgi:hypothetical protein
MRMVHVLAGGPRGRERHGVGDNLAKLHCLLVEAGRVRHGSTWVALTVLALDRAEPMLTLLPGALTAEAAHSDVLTDSLRRWR